jgi:hypothetical protein
VDRGALMEKIYCSHGISIFDFNDTEIRYLMKIEQNDIMCIKNNYQNIDPKNAIKCFILSAIISTSIQIVDFLAELIV